MTDTQNISASKAGVILFCLAWSLLVGIGLVKVSSWLPDAPDQFTYDLRTLYFSKQEADSRSDIAIVLLSDDTLEGYACRSPIDRRLLASLVWEIAGMGAKAIGLDFFFTQKTPDDAALLGAIKGARDDGVPVVLAALDSHWKSAHDLSVQDDFIKQTPTTKNPKPASAGHILLGNQRGHLTIGDQTVRFMVEAPPQSAERLSFAEYLAEVDGPKPKPASSLIAWLLPPKEPGADTFPTLEVPRQDGAEAVSKNAHILPEAWKSVVQGKIVLVGGSFPDRDLHRTPLSVIDRTPVPGVTVHAQIVAQLRDGRSVHLPSKLGETLLVALVACLGFYVARRWKLEKGEWLITAAAFAVLIAIGAALFWAFSFVLPSATIVLAWPLGVIAGNRADAILNWRPIRRLVG